MGAGWTRRGVCLGLVLAGATRARAADLPRMVVTKDPSCGCCRAWAEHVRAAGFPVEIVESASVARLKARLGVPQDLAGCHTAEVGGYVVEGHVPAADVQRLLKERPAVAGIAVPGMPIGSPGMEVPGMKAQAFDVIAFTKQGTTRVFASH